jgi:hypothetical protein
MNSVLLDDVKIPSGLTLVVGAQGSGKSATVSRTPFTREVDLPTSQIFDFVYTSSLSFLSSVRDAIRSNIAKDGSLKRGNVKFDSDYVNNYLLKLDREIANPTSPFVLCEEFLSDNISFCINTPLPTELILFRAIRRMIGNIVGHNRANSITSLVQAADFTRRTGFHVNTYFYTEQETVRPQSEHLTCYATVNADGVVWTLTDGKISAVVENISLAVLICGCFGIASVSSASPTFFTSSGLPDRTAKGGLSLGYLDYISSLNLCATNIGSCCVLEVRDDFEDFSHKLASSSRIYVNLEDLTIEHNRYRGGWITSKGTEVVSEGWSTTDYERKFLKPMISNLAALRKAKDGVINTSTLGDNMFTLLGGQNV